MNQSLGPPRKLKSVHNHQLTIQICAVPVLGAMRTMFWRGLVLFGYLVCVDDGFMRNAWKTAKKMTKETITCAPYVLMCLLLS